jgi:hypothetical protein
MPGVARCALAAADTDRRFADVFRQIECGRLAIDYGGSHWADPILFRNVVGVPAVSKEVLSQHTADYQAWGEAFARNHRLPIESAEKGLVAHRCCRPAGDETHPVSSRGAPGLRRGRLRYWRSAPPRRTKPLSR